MTECKHYFIGTAEGVHCGKCGLKLTAEEYARLMAKPDERKPEKKEQKKEPAHILVPFNTIKKGGISPPDNVTVSLPLRSTKQ